MIKDRWKDIYEDAEAPVTGNPKGDVTVVEFFDYQCGFCKRAHEETEKVLAEDKNLRYVYKQFPILGPNSLLAAKAAVAAHKQGKFLPLHTAFMKHKLPLTEEEINKLAKDVGLDVDKLKQDMESEPVVAYVNKSRELAESLGGRGTPLFVIGDKTYPGAMGTDQIKEILAGIRASATPKTP
ncbi:MAG: DsbA family protein [Alphaproteobacteria bacterium]|nr:DsbA family protein [Alphaproteobacteria bacterium]